MTPKIIGPKWIAYSPGKGELIRGTKTEEIFLYLRADMLGGDSLRFSDTAFRAYGSQYDRSRVNPSRART